MFLSPSPRKYLLYISQNYSFEILRPLQEAILARGDQCAWFVEGKTVNLNNFMTHEQRLKDIPEVINYQPDAVFVPGNLVPRFIPGLKVQIFHGLEWKKKGHFTIRGFFDLYCTHGNITTSRFKQLAEQHGHFHVVETGWPKLDPLFKVLPYPLETNLPVVLFAPTFSPNLTSALTLFEHIKLLIQNQNYYWLIKFHPKMNAEWIKRYESINAKNFSVVKIDSVLPLLQRSDVLLSDTSSIIGEFLLLNKPAVTYKNIDPGNYLIDFSNPQDLTTCLNKALNDKHEILEKIHAANQQLHPYDDGLSSQRILDATDELLNHPKPTRRKKPLNFLRALKLRRRLNYWKW